MPTKKIYTNTLAQIAGKVATALISIAMIKILTGYLDIAGYGLYSKIYNYLSIFSVIADLGLYTITIREITKHQDDPKMVQKISSNILTLRTLSGIIIIGSSLAISPFLSGYNTSMAYVGILIAGFFTLMGLINSSLMSYLQAILKAEFSFIANISGKCTTFGIILLCAFWLYPSDSGIPEYDKYILIMLAGLIGNIVMTGLTWWYAKKWQPIEFAWDSTYIKYILRISLPYGVALFLNAIFFKVDTILLSILEPVHIADIAVALYALPMKIVEVGMMYGTIFLNSFLPVLTAAIEKKEIKKIQYLTKNAFEILFAFGVGISLFLFLFREEVIRLISTQEYLTTSVNGYFSQDVMAIVVWIFLFYFVSSLFTYVLIAQGEQRKMLTINAWIAGFNIIGNIIFIPIYSFIGSAWVTLVTQFLLILITGWYVRGYLSIQKICFSGVFLMISTILAGGISIWIVSLFSQDIPILTLVIGGISFAIPFIGGFLGVRRYFHE